ncbi:MAG: hypothetical protein LAT80_11440 [Balneolaceae bacterium]|nr:hypothetical protein [Balneolaceae bacterium]
MAESPEEKKCFIICPIGESGSPNRIRSDALLKYVFTPVLSDKGYVPVRADQIPKAGMITTQIINLVAESPLVIADLTDGNPNVFYELAIRHATGRPYVQVIEIGEKIPFDTSGVRTIPIDHRDLDSVEACKNEIGKQIDHFHSGHKADSPISVATNVRLLQSDSEYAERLFEKLEEIHGGLGWVSIDDLGDKLDDIERKLDDMESKIDDKI